MTTIQIRTGDQSVTVNGEDLLVASSTLLRVLVADGDHLVVELPQANAGSASEGPDVDALRHASAALRATNEEQAQRLEAQSATIRDLQARERRLGSDLRAATDRLRELDPGTNFHNDNEPSDRRPGLNYRVSLYRRSDGSIRGQCQCMDFHLHGGILDPTYRCKHIDRQIAKVGRSAYVANTSLRAV